MAGLRKTPFIFYAKNIKAVFSLDAFVSLLHCGSG